MAWSASAPACPGGGAPIKATLQKSYSSKCPPGRVDSTTVYGASAMGITQFRDKTVLHSEVTPDLEQRREEGRILPYTQYVVEDQAYRARPCNHLGNCYTPTRYPSRRYRYEGQATNFTTVMVKSPPEVLVPDVDPLLQEAWAAAKTDGFDLLTELAESPKTVDMFSRYVKAVQDRIKRAKPIAAKRRKRKGKLTSETVADSMANAWMETRYGWRPLMYASEEIREQWERWKSSERPFVHARTLGRQQASRPCEDSISSYTNYGTGWGIRHGSYHTLVVEVRAKVLLELSRGTVPAMVDINPLATGWEIVPLSFVCDWFLNTSDIFRAHWPLAMVSDYTACTSVKTTERVDFSIVQVDPPDPAHNPLVEAGGARFSGRNRRYERYPVLGIPFSLTVRPRLSIAKMADLGFIVRGIAKRYLPRGLTRGW